MTLESPSGISLNLPSVFLYSSIPYYAFWNYFCFFIFSGHYRLRSAVCLANSCRQSSAICSSFQLNKLTALVTPFSQAFSCAFLASFSFFYFSFSFLFTWKAFLSSRFPGDSQQIKMPSADRLRMWRSLTRALSSLAYSLLFPSPCYQFRIMTHFEYYPRGWASVSGIVLVLIYLRHGG